MMPLARQAFGERLLAERIDRRRRAFLRVVGEDATASLAAPVAAEAAPATLPPLPRAGSRLPVLGRSGAPALWRDFIGRHPSQFSGAAERIDLADHWSTILATLAAAPRLAYARGDLGHWRLAEEERPAGTGNCNTAMLTLRRDLGVRGLPLAALPPAIVESDWAGPGEDAHLQLCLLTRDHGDLAFDWRGGEAPILGPLPWETFPVRWISRLRQYFSWERLRDAPPGATP